MIDWIVLVGGLAIGFGVGWILAERLLWMRAWNQGWDAGRRMQRTLCGLLHGAVEEQRAGAVREIARKGGGKR